jgi:energy-coupling factor transporter transmembrane protein EcfT
MIDLIKKYVDNRIKLVKIELVSVLANVIAGLVSSFMILLMITFIVLMLSISLAFWMSSLFDSNTIGFLIVGGIYILVFFIYMAFSKDYIDTKVKDKIVSRAFKTEEELQDGEYVDFDDE